jgi:hypothetical protein
MKIEEIRGARAIVDPEFRVPELSISGYCEFLKNWEEGAYWANQNPGYSFASLWLHIPQFKESMEKSLAILGVKDAGKLTAAKLEELLIYSGDPEDPRGMVFRLHQDSPNPKTMALEPQS